MTTPSDLDGAAVHVREDGDYRGNWIQTYTGHPFYPFDPQASRVVIQDIAHALAMTCRFTGHVEQFYSVAQHCVLASQLVPEEHALEALLHDAGEAYLTDLPSPIKAGMPQYQEMEAGIEQRIMEEFGIVAKGEPYTKAAAVKHVDLLLVATEARDLMANPPTMWQLPVAPLVGMEVVSWSWQEAEREYLRRFEQLTRRVPA